MESSKEIMVRIGLGLLRDGGDRNTYIHQESRLDLEFFIDPLVLYWIVLHLFVETVAPGCLDNTMGEDLKGKQ